MRQVLTNEELLAVATFEKQIQDDDVATMAFELLRLREVVEHYKAFQRALRDV